MKQDLDRGGIAGEDDEFSDSTAKKVSTESGSVGWRRTHFRDLVHSLAPFYTAVRACCRDAVSCVAYLDLMVVVRLLDEVVDFDV